MLGDGMEWGLKMGNGAISAFLVVSDREPTETVLSKIVYYQEKKQNKQTKEAKVNGAE